MNCKKCGVMLLGGEFGSDKCEICEFKEIIKAMKIKQNSNLAKEIRKQVVTWR